MNCIKDIHDEIRITDIVCPFCDKQLAKRCKKDEPCCENKELENDNGISMQVI